MKKSKRRKNIIFYDIENKIMFQKKALNTVLAACFHKT